MPGPLKSRFVIGDPVWKEIHMRDDLQSQYEEDVGNRRSIRCWIIISIWPLRIRTAATSGATENVSVVVLKGSWAYKVQVSVKFSDTYRREFPCEPADSASPPEVCSIQATRTSFTENQERETEHYPYEGLRHGSATEPVLGPSGQARTEVDGFAASWGFLGAHVVPASVVLVSTPAVLSSSTHDPQSPLAPPLPPLPALIRVWHSGRTTTPAPP